MRRSRTAWIVGGATLAGLLLGWVAVQGRQRQHRAGLFSDRPSRRAAALGYLAGQPGLDAIRVLQDYLRWETQPPLRRRALGLVRRFEAQLP